ncbi:MAG: hypothetical protein ACREDR_25885 [Blastocatellia bacterium]
MQAAVLMAVLSIGRSISAHRSCRDVTDILGRATDFYFHWRYWVIAFGLVGCVLALWVQKPLSRAWAWRLFVFVLMWALMPAFLELISN